MQAGGGTMQPRSRRPLVSMMVVVALVLLGVVYIYWHHHMVLMNVQLGGMSQHTKKFFWQHGVDCQESYDVQGYETSEGLQRMFSLQAQQLYHLNPHISMSELPRGTTICIKGVWGIAAGTFQEQTWFLPVVMVLCLLAGAGLAAMMGRPRWVGGHLLPGGPSGVAAGAPGQA